MSAKQEWVIGIHAVAELLRQQPESVQRLLVLEGREDDRHRRIVELARKARIKVEQVPKRVLNLSAPGVHQGVAAQCEVEDRSRNEAFLHNLLEQLEHEPLLLVLDGVTDPHNLGACLRSADAAGVDAVILPKDNSASVNMTVRKVACGAAETVNLITVTNLQRCLIGLQERGVWIVGTTGDAETNLYQQDLTGSIALVMGSEGKGMRRLTRETCDFLVSLPMAGSVSSINVSVATGVSLFEARRQRSAE